MQVIHLRVDMVELVSLPIKVVEQLLAVEQLAPRKQKMRNRKRVQSIVGNLLRCSCQELDGLVYAAKIRAKCLHDVLFQGLAFCFKFEPPLTLRPCNTDCCSDEGTNLGIPR